MHNRKVIFWGVSLVTFAVLIIAFEAVKGSRVSRFFVTLERTDACPTGCRPMHLVDRVNPRGPGILAHTHVPGKLEPEMIEATKHVVYRATITNATSRVVVLDGVLFEWRNRSGIVESCHAFSGAGIKMKPGEHLATTCCVPLESELVRASTIDDQASFLPRFIDRLASCLRISRNAAVASWLIHKGLMPDGLCHPHRGHWMANP